MPEIGNDEMHHNMSVAVISCLNHKNLGMYSVDLAADSFFASLGIRPDYYCAHNPPRRGKLRFKRLLGIDIGNKKFDRVGSIRKRFLHSMSQLSRYDLVCYWGDFTTNPVFLERSFPLCEGFSETSGGVDRWMRLFGANAHHPMKVSIGQNFQHSSLLVEPELTQLLVGSTRSMRGIFPRDSVSTDNLRRCDISNEIQIDTFLDCAFFLGVDSRSTGQPCAPKSRHFGTFFGRSGLGVLKNHIGELEQNLDLDSVWLHGWLTSSANTIHADFSRNLEIIRSAHFVVTDTYHVAVNCLRERVFPIVLGQISHDQEGTLGDFKKKVLMNDVGLSDLYVEISPESKEDPSILLSEIETRAKAHLNLSKEDQSNLFSTIEAKIDANLSKFSTLLFDQNLPTPPIQAPII